jgi:hypothetical protein
LRRPVLGSYSSPVILQQFVHPNPNW